MGFSIIGRTIRFFCNLFRNSMNALKNVKVKQHLNNYYMFLSNSIIFISLVVFLFLPSLTYAQTACSQFYVGGQFPKTEYVGRNLCFQDYALAFSDLTMTNLYSAELLTRDQVKASQKIKRYGLFDNRDPVIRDYRNSGYDRGHMTPSGDMPKYSSQIQTFLSTNIVPQRKQLNSGKWNWIEHQIRLMALYYGQLYVVTGPYFHKPIRKIGEYRIWIPYGTWKAIYIPTLNRAGVYFCRNRTRPVCYRMSVAFFRDKTGIDPFPALSEEIKQIKILLPKPVKPKLTTK